MEGITTVSLIAKRRDVLAVMTATWVSGWWLRGSLRSMNGSACELGNTWWGLWLMYASEKGAGETAILVRKQEPN
jgi:hypothetical protein